MREFRVKFGSFCVLIAFTVFIMPFLIQYRRKTLINPIVDPINLSEHVINEIKNTHGTILPSIGIMIEFYTL